MKTNRWFTSWPLAVAMAAMALPAPLGAQENRPGPGVDIRINGRKIEVGDAWRAIERAMDDAKVPPETRRMLMQRALEMGQQMQSAPGAEAFAGEIERMREELKRRMEPRGEGARGPQPAGGEPGESASGGASPWRVGLMCEPVEDSLRAHLPIPQGTGLVVRRVMEGSPAAEAGLKVNDVLLASGDRALDSFETLVAAVREAGKEGKALKLRVLHEGKERVVEVKPEGPPPVAAKPEAKEAGAAAPLDAGRVVDELRERIERQQREIQQLQKRLSGQEREIRKLRESLAPKQG